MAGRKGKKAVVGKLDELDRVCAELNELYPQPVICRADQMNSTYNVRRPSGHMQLDLDTGGGFPAGGLSTISGEDQSGKTELLYYLIAMNQRIHRERSACAFAPIEGGFDIERARTAGVQVALPASMVEQENRARAQWGELPMTKEEIGTTMGRVELLRGDTGEETLGAVLRAVHEKAFQLILIDSFSALMPEANADKDLNEVEKRAAWATMMTKFAHYLYGCFNPIRSPNYTTVIGTQQMRANQERANAASFMQKYLPTAVAKESWAIRHIALIRLVLHEGSKIKRKIQGKDTVIGKVLKWELKKGKAGTRNNITGEAPFYYDGFSFPPGLNKLGSIIIAGIRHGVLHERKDGVFKVWPKEEHLASSIRKLEEMMFSDQSLEMRLRFTIMGKNGIKRGFTV